MPVYSGSWLDRVLVQQQTTLLALPNTGGTWTSAGAVLLRHQSLTATPRKDVAVTPYKTGTRSTLVGLPGRRSGTFSLSFPLVPNGTAGVAPDADSILQATFGQAGATVSSTSVTYNFLDTGYIPLAIIRYNLSGGSSPTNFMIGGGVIQRLTFSLGGDYFMCTAEGKSVFVSDSTQFSSYTGVDLQAAMGLSVFPVQPGGLSVNGSPINGFGGTATFDSGNETDLRGTPSIVISTGLDFAEDAFENGYPFAITGGRRTVSSGTIKCIDNDGSQLNDIKTKAFTKSAINISLQLNTTTGSIVTMNMNNVQMGAYSLVENGSAFDINFGDSMAHASSATTVNDFSLVFS